MKRSDLLSAFTPSTMSAATLEAIFVKREPLARKIVDSIAHSAASGGREHHIAVGPRGIGKTHLLSLVTYRLLTDPMFLDKAVIAWLREEEWGIGSIGELYEAILMQLASDDTPILAVHQAARSAVDQLAGCTLEDLPDKAEYLLTQVLGDRMLVVVVENLDLLFASIGIDDQHRLRAYLQNERNTVLLASTPSLSSSISQRSGLFFGFFAIHHLDELDVEEARTLLENIAALREDKEGRDLAAYLATDEATRRLETVQDLVGGHPRLWVLMAECITTERLEEVVDLLVAVLDDLTPYYQSQMASLTPQQQKIVMVLSRGDGALAPKAIAAQARIQERVVAKQLGDLAKMGFVRVADLPEGVTVKDKRIRPYELREPLLRHVLEVKDSRGKPLRVIVEFLRAWYDRPRLEEWATSASPLTASYAAAALAALYEAVSNAPDSGQIPLTAARDRTHRQPQEPARWGDLGFALGQADHHLEAIEAYERASDLDPTDPAWPYNLGVALHRLERFEDALLSYDRALVLGPNLVKVQVNRGSALASLGRHEEAVHAFDAVLNIDPSLTMVRAARAASLGHLDRDREALEELDDVVKALPGHSTSRYNRAVVLAHLGDIDGAIEDFQTVLAIDPLNVEATWNLIALRLSEKQEPLDYESLKTALELPVTESARQRLLLMLVHEVAALSRPDQRRESVFALTAAAASVDHSTGLLSALVVDLERDASTSRDVEWLRTWVAAARENTGSNGVVRLIEAIADYREHPDGAVLLALPSELRTLAFSIIRLEPPSP